MAFPTKKSVSGTAEVDWDRLSIDGAFATAREWAKWMLTRWGGIIIKFRDGDDRTEFQKDTDERDLNRLIREFNDWSEAFHEHRAQFVASAASPCKCGLMTFGSATLAAHGILRKFLIFLATEHVQHTQELSEAENVEFEMGFSNPLGDDSVYISHFPIPRIAETGPLTIPTSTATQARVEWYPELFPILSHESRFDLSDRKLSAMIDEIQAERDRFAKEYREGERKALASSSTDDPSNPALWSKKRRMAEWGAVLAQLEGLNTAYTTSAISQRIKAGKLIVTDKDNGGARIALRTLPTGYRDDMPSTLKEKPRKRRPSVTKASRTTRDLKPAAESPR